MIRKGIYSLKELDKASFKDIFGKEKNISIYLYQKINQISDIEKRSQYAELVLNRFNSDRNVIKRTYKNRFDKFDTVSIKLVGNQNYERISVLDIAISDGRASCFFLEHSKFNLQNLHYTGSDIQINYYLNKKHEDSKSYIVTDEYNKVVEITKPPFVWNIARSEGSFYFLNNLLKKHFLRKTKAELLRNEFQYKSKLELLHPDFKMLLTNNTNFQIQNYNLFDSISEKYNVIRAMNILHTGYFSMDQLNKILNNLYNGLDIDGLLIEGSNEKDGTPVEGAIFNKTEQGFILLCEPENPSRIKELVLSFKPCNHNGQ